MIQPIGASKGIGVSGRLLVVVTLKLSAQLVDCYKKVALNSKMDCLIVDFGFVKVKLLNLFGH